MISKGDDEPGLEHLVEKYHVQLYSVVVLVDKKRIFLQNL